MSNKYLEKIAEQVTRPDDFDRAHPVLRGVGGWVLGSLAGQATGVAAHLATGGRLPVEATIPLGLSGAVYGAYKGYQSGKNKNKKIDDYLIAHPEVATALQTK